jgi:thioesterase domain-containing protein
MEINHLIYRRDTLMLQDYETVTGDFLEDFRENETLQNIAEVIKGKFIHNRPDEALNYVYNILPALESTGKLEKMFRIEMIYLEHLSQSEQYTTTSKLFFEFLKTINTRIDKNRWLAQNYKNNFCNAIFKQALLLGKSLSEKSYRDTVSLYDYAVDFLLSADSLLAYRLIIEKGDLLIANAESESAFNVYNSIFFHMHLATLREALILDKYLITLLVQTLERICEINNNSATYQQFIKLLRDDDNNELKNVIHTIKTMTPIDYNLIKPFYFIFNILDYCSAAPEIISSKVFETINEYKDFITYLKNEISIFHAIIKQDEKKLADLLKANINTNLALKNMKCTPLQRALQTKNVTITSLLIKLGKVDIEESCYPPPIYLAIKSGVKDLVALLLKANANPNLTVPTENGVTDTPLFRSILSQHTAISKLLIKHGAKLLPAEKQYLKDSSHPCHQEYKKLLTFFPKRKQNRDLITFLAGDLKTPKTPLFCIHAIDGSIHPYKKFAKILSKVDKDRPIWGINSPGVIEKEIPPTIEEMARLYIRLIKKTQKNGPYMLAGWSFGGLLAFEIARLLHEEYQNLSLLCLFDCVAPTEIQSMTPQCYAKYLLNTFNVLNKYWENEDGAKNYKPTLETLSKLSKKEQIDAILPPITKIQKQSMKQLHAILKSNLLAAVSYNPPKMDNSSLFLTCFNAQESCNKFGPTLGWENSKVSYIPRTNKPGIYIGPNIVCQIFPETSHFSLLQNESNLELIAEFISVHPFIRAQELKTVITKLKTEITKHSSSIEVLSKEYNKYYPGDQLIHNLPSSPTTRNNMRFFKAAGLPTNTASKALLPETLSTNKQL